VPGVKDDVVPGGKDDTEPWRSTTPTGAVDDTVPVPENAVPHTVVPRCPVPGADHVVERASAGDLDGIADALAAAFSDYAWTRWIVDHRDHTARLRRLQELTAGRVGLPHGEVWVARCPGQHGGETHEGDPGARGTGAIGGTVVGALVALHPDRKVPISVWRDMAPEEEELMGDRAEAAAEAEQAASHLRPPGRLVDVATIGVHPSHWRLGLATRLLRPALDLAGELGAAAYLETSSAGNVVLYERNGFTVIGEASVPGGGPHVWAMRT